jgi:hypothetical protein
VQRKSLLFKVPNFKTIIYVRLQGQPPPIVLLFELLKGAAELVGAGGTFAAAVYAVQARNHVVYLLAGHQSANALKVAVAASQECYLLDYIVITGHYVYQ